MAATCEGARASPSECMHRVPFGSLAWSLGALGTVSGVSRGVCSVLLLRPRSSDLTPVCWPIYMGCASAAKLFMSCKRLRVPCGLPKMHETSGVAQCLNHSSTTLSCCHGLSSSLTLSLSLWSEINGCRALASVASLVAKVCASAFSASVKVGS